MNESVVQFLTFDRTSKSTHGSQVQHQCTEDDILAALEEMVADKDAMFSHEDSEDILLNHLKLPLTQRMDSLENAHLETSAHLVHLVSEHSQHFKFKAPRDSRQQ